MARKGQNQEIMSRKTVRFGDQLDGDQLIRKKREGNEDFLI